MRKLLREHCSWSRLFVCLLLSCLYMFLADSTKGYEHGQRNRF
jgi:hypothetical protein